MILKLLENELGSFNVKSTFSSEESGRTTTIFEQPYVLKYFSSSKKHKNEWVTEHDVISTLIKKGIFVPKSYGYRMDETGASLYKEFIPGQLIQRYTSDSVVALAQLFADFHDNNVITRDAHDGNIIQAENNKLLFIDFGKAAIFKRKNMQFWLTLAREIFFIKTKVIKDNAIYSTFLKNYLLIQSSEHKLALRTLIVITGNILALRDNLRHFRRNKRLTAS